MRFEAVILVGAGGTGSIIAEPMMRLLAYHPNGCKTLVIADGDKYENKNHERQMFSGRRNKAETTKRRLKNPAKACGVEVIAISDYLSAMNFTEILDGLPNELLVVTAVDNYASRREIIQILSDRKKLNFTVVDPGNELDHGDVTTSIFRNGKWLGPNPLKKHPKIAKPADRIPDRGGCTAAAKSAPQLLVSNFWAAGLSLAVIQALLDDQKYCDDTKFDIRKLRAGPIGEMLSTPKTATKVLLHGKPGVVADQNQSDRNARGSRKADRRTRAQAAPQPAATSFP